MRTVVEAVVVPKMLQVKYSVHNVMYFVYTVVVYSY